MKYFLDCEFIEDGKTIDLLSIALICEDGRELYCEVSDADFSKASDWVKENVLPHLWSRQLDKSQFNAWSRDGGVGGLITKKEITREIIRFIDIDNRGKPEIWGYYSAYDWVAFCQLFGAMIDLPKGYPMFCRDIIQECKRLGNPELPKQDSVEHNCLADARWNKQAYEFLNNLNNH